MPLRFLLFRHYALILLFFFALGLMYIGPSVLHLPLLSFDISVFIGYVALMMGLGYWYAKHPPIIRR